MTRLGEILPFWLLFKAQANFRGGGGVRSPKNGNILGNFFQKQNLYIFHLKGSFKTWYVVVVLRFKSSLIYMFLAFTFSFDVDILAYFCCLIVSAIFSKMWVIFSNHLVTLACSIASNFLPVSKNCFAKKLPQCKCRFKLIYIGEVCYGSCTLAMFVRKNVTDIAWQFHLPYLPWPIEKILT